MSDRFQTGKVPLNIHQLNIPAGNGQNWRYGLRANSQNFDFLPALVGFSVGLLIVGFFSYNSYDIEDSYILFGVLGGVLFTYSMYEAIGRHSNRLNFDRRINSHKFAVTEDASGIISATDPIYHRASRALQRLDPTSTQQVMQGIAQIRQTNAVGMRYGPGSRMAVSGNGSPFSAMNLSIAERPGLAGSMRRIPG